MLNSETSTQNPQPCLLLLKNLKCVGLHGTDQFQLAVSLICGYAVYTCPSMCRHDPLSVYTQACKILHTFIWQDNLTCCIILLLGLQYKCIVSAYIIQLFTTCVGVIKSHPKVAFFVTSDAGFFSYKWPVYIWEYACRIISSLTCYCCRMLGSKCWFIIQQVGIIVESQIEFSVRQQKLLV